MGDRGEAAEMKALINLECIGDGGSRGSRADYWVAEVIGLSPHFGVKRQFLGCHKDYSRANSVGSRGVYAYYVVESGHIYEVSEPLSWKKVDQYFCTVDGDGEIVRLTIEDVLAHFNKRSGSAREELEGWLRDHSASTSTTPLENG